MNIKSPVTGSTNVMFLKEIPCSFIIDAYRKRLNTDVTKYFEGLSTIQLYQCLDSKLKFYYPGKTAGDDEFYGSLEQFPWYYMEWKWEHAVAQGLIKKTDDVLEVGCGDGNFLKGISSVAKTATGLELNKSAVKKGTESGLRIFDQSIQDFARANPNMYDVVCMFQVLEHIPYIKDFLEASVATLKPGGSLIISVPNNVSNSPILESSILNMPPHHAGLWDAVSLTNLQSLFGIKLENIITEPLQTYHYSAYQDLIKNKYIEKYGFAGKIINKLTRSISLRAIDYLSNYIFGHSIMLVYKKK